MGGYDVLEGRSGVHGWVELVVSTLPMGTFNGGCGLMIDGIVEML